MRSTKLSLAVGPVVIVISLFIFYQPAEGYSPQQQDLPCVGLTNDWMIPDDGSYLQICVTDPGAPENSTIAETNVKLLIDHRDLSQVELLLLRGDSKLVLPLSVDEIGADGIIKFNQIHDFDGMPSKGTWVFQIRDIVPGIVGTVKGLSISSLYQTEKNRSSMTNVNHGRLTSIRIPENTKKVSGSYETDEVKESEITKAYQLDNDLSITIMSESFEYTFPPMIGWEIKDTNDNDGKEIYWDDDSLRPYSGYWGAWPARGGADGIDPTIDTNYPANMDTWMVYGPFDLSNAKSAELTFQLWRDVEEIYDWIFCGISEDGNIFYGTGWDGNVGWETETLSLDDYLGDSDVWIAWYFHSDASFQYKGPWIDDIALKFVPGDVTIQGNFTYADRLSTMRGAKGI